MKLSIVVEERAYQIEIPDNMLAEAEEFFRKMDGDMDRGWQISREYVENPNQLERCQIVANKLFTALETENRDLAELMAGYILSRMPGVQRVDIDATGEMQATEFIMGPGAAPGGGPATGSKLTKLQAMEQADKDVSKVYKVGRNYRYAVFDHTGGNWVESPLFDSREAADEARMVAFRARFDQLTGK